MSAPVVPGVPPAEAPDGAHLDDAVLVRALDGELLPEDGAAAAHLARCAACTTRMAQLRDRRARLSALLASTAAAVPDVPMPDARVPEAPEFEVPLPAAPRTPATAVVVRGEAPRVLLSTPGWRAARAAPRLDVPLVIRPSAYPGARARRRVGARLAAAGVLVAAAGLAAQPVRQWVAARWAGITDVTDAAQSRAAARGVAVAHSAFDTAAGAAVAPVVVTFTPAPGPFAVHFDERPVGGTLTVRVAPGPRVTAAARPGRGERAGDFVVLPAGLRVRNAAAPRGDYDVSVPAGTTRLRVTFDVPAAETVLSLGGRDSLVWPLRSP